MDKDRIAGSTTEVKGSLKHAVGRMTSSAKLRAGGRADTIEAIAGWGRQDAVRDALRKYRTSQLFCSNRDLM